MTRKEIAHEIIWEALKMKGSVATNIHAIKMDIETELMAFCDTYFEDERKRAARLK